MNPPVRPLVRRLQSAWSRPRSLRSTAASGATCAALLFAAGCKIGPDYTQPAVDVNSAWLDETMPGSTGQQVNPRWWEVFNDPTLTKLVEQAYAQNLTLRAAGLRVIEARARRQIVVGQFYPQVQQGVGGVGLNQLGVNSVTGQTAGQTDRSFADAAIGLEAAWELDFWGKFRRGIEADDALLLATVADYDAVMTSLAADVASTYILIRSTEERLEVAQRNVDLQQRTFDLTQFRLRAGDVSELDVVTAQSTLAHTQASIPELKNILMQSKLTLSVLLGRTPSQLEAQLAPAEGSPKGLPTAPAEIAAGIPADLLRRRPDVRAAERQAAAQCARIGIATAELLPRISINGLTAFTSSNFEGLNRPNLSNIFDANSFTGFLGVGFNWPILNYGRIQGNIRAQDALFERAVTGYQETVLRAAADVESGLSEFLRAREREGLIATSVAATKRGVEISFLQYRLGAVDFIRVNDAQVTLVAEEDNLVTARARIALGAVRAYRALGGGWEIREGHEFVDAETVRRMRERTNWGDALAPNWGEGSDLGFKRPDSNVSPAPANPEQK